MNELSAANEVLADAAAGLRRELDASQVMGELAQEAALEVGRAADAHLEQLETVAMDATMLADQRQAELEALREQVVDLVQVSWRAPATRHRHDPDIRARPSLPACFARR